MATLLSWKCSINSIAWSVPSNCYAINTDSALDPFCSCSDPLPIIAVFANTSNQNEIRMYTWWQVGKYPGTPDGLSMSPLKNRMHVDHCIESIRIALMCWGDVTPLLIRMGGPAGAKADFNTHHRCRNFDKLENWIDNNWTVK